ncbi:Nnf1-domain-containing protein [Xylariales sp. AK1849]|nr:Nnf1-domain-containing protein [Xylariales sp. AK1849]
MSEPAPTPSQEPDPAPPASPPLPTPHNAVTPGPRAARFQTVLDQCLSRTLGKITWDNFASCYPTIAAQASGTLKAVQRQMVERLGVLCKKEFDSILQSRNVVAKLNDLESLVSEAQRRRDEAGLVDEKDIPVPPHLLPPSSVLAAHLSPHLALQQSQLNAKLQTTQAHNAKLFADIQKQRAELESLMGLVEKLFEDIDGANAAMDGVAEDLARETRTVEVEMQAEETRKNSSVYTPALSGATWLRRSFPVVGETGLTYLEHLRSRARSWVPCRWGLRVGRKEDVANTETLTASEGRLKAQGRTDAACHLRTPELQTLSGTAS